MKMKTKGCIASALTLLAVFISLIIFSGLNTEEEPLKAADLTLSPVSDETESVVIVSTEKTDYSLFFSSDAISADQEAAKSLEKLIKELYNVRMTARPDTSSPELEHEILIGNTNRPESQEFHEALLSTAPASEDFVWGYAYKEGKLLFTANSSLAYSFGAAEFLAYLTESDFTVAADLFVMRLKTRAEYDQELKDEFEANKAQYIKKLLEMNAEFKQADFGGDPQEMPTDLYEDPHTYPQANQHPRYFVTAEDLEELRYNFETNPDYKELRNQIYNYADKVREDYTGIFPEKTDKNGETYRFDNQMLAQLEAKAFVYLLTGDETYGYEAIIGAKNAMLSVKYTVGLHMDVYHGPSQVMVNVAKVYDWCYDLLTEDDKNQLIAGVSNVLGPQMESGMRFPPTGMNAVSGHGTGPQFIRDWMTVAIVFYDEMPSWWDMVGGRFYQYYVPVINVASENGWASQGTVTYGDSKYFTRSWAAYLVKKTTGEFPYNEEDFRQCAYYYFSYIQPNGNYFQTGDGPRSPAGCGISDSCAYMMLAALLYQDPTIGAVAKKYTNNYTRFSYAFTTELTVPDMFIFRTLGPDVNEEPMEKIDTIQYLKAPAATMTARTSWSEDAAAVLMRMGTMTMANHDLADHGTFQIYYKGLLAGTSGAYKHYGGNVHKFYLQATVAHNGLLVFDPSKADAEPQYASDGTTMLNAARYYYSGSQRALPSPHDIETWTSGEYEMGQMLGASWEYNRDGSEKYAYIAADLTAAYPKETVEFLSRRMLTLFTGDESMPILFFTFDQIVGKGEDYTKTWLLHTVKEPTLDEENLTATVVEGGGRLVLHSLSGADAISKVGGRGKDFWINGKNCTDEYTDEDANYEKIWGRLEITSAGTLENSFLNVMYVTDADSTATLELESVKNESVEYVKALRSFAVFTKAKSDLQAKEFSFTTEGAGLYEYYISGLEAGSWKVKVDGVNVATVFADDGEGFVSFIAPAGDVVLTPGADVIGSNGGRIKYSTGGGIFSGDYPIVYKNEEVTPLPTNISKSESKFLGWYTSPSFEPETFVTEIPLGMTGTFNVYAKWLSNLLNIDYTSEKHLNVNVTSGLPSVNGVTYNTNNGAGVLFKAETDEDGNQYLNWQKGSASSFITVSNTVANYASMTSDDECASFTVTLSKNGDAPVPSTQFRIYARKDASGLDAISRQFIFTTNEKGEVRLGNSAGGPVAGVIDEGKTTLRIVLDFKNEELRAYDAYGNITAKTAVSVSALNGAKPGVSTMSEWRSLVNQILMYWICNGAETDAALKVYSIRIDEGDRFAELEPEDGMIVYNTGGGGTLSSSAPLYYSKETPTELPTPTPLEGNVFRGWYTTPDFKAGTEITEIPADAEGVFFVYARWTVNILTEDYADSELNVTNGSKKEGLITYQINSVAGSSFTTKTDASGNKYLTWCDAGGANTQPFIIMNNGAIAASSEPYISYEFTFSKNGSEPLETFYMRTLAQHDVNGTKLSSSNSIGLFKITDDGIYLSKNYSAPAAGADDIKIGSITDGKMTVRVVIDFVECKVKAYNENGVNVGELAFGIPETSGAADGVEFMKCFQTYVFYMMSTTPQDVLNTSVNIHKIKIDSGNAFEASAVDGQLNYVTNGAQLPSDAPTEYSKETPTVLPALTKEGFSFGGWYTSPSFEEASKITVIPTSTVGALTVYAKWNVLNEIVYNLGGGALPENAPKTFSEGVATVLPIPTISRRNVTFAGWYTTPDFKDGTLVTEVPVGVKDSFTVYAKWIFSVEIDFNDTDINIKDSQTATVEDFQIKANSATSLKTAEDGQGGKYLEVIGGGKAPQMVMLTGDIAKSTNTSVSYEFTLGKNGDAPFPDISFRILAKVDVNGTALTGGNNQLYMIRVTDSGAYLYNDQTAGENGYELTEEYKFADFDENGKMTVKFEVDFKNKYLIGYKADGSIAATPLIIPEKAGTQDGVKYMKTFTQYVMYFHIATSEGEEMRLYSVKVTDDKVFTANGGIIEYHTGEGTLPEDASKYYSDEAATVLPTPTRIGYDFMGWYTTEDFEHGTLVTEVPADAEGVYRVYAKWEETYIPEDGRIVYNLAGGTLSSDAPLYFIPGSQTATALPIPTWSGYTFGGWYTTPDFAGAETVTEIPAGYTGEFAVYAKWSKAAISEDYSSNTVNADGSSQKVNNISYNANGKTDCTILTKDENGNRYAEWVNGSEDPIIAVNNGAIAKMTLPAVSYEVKMARNGDAPFMATSARITIQYDVNGIKLGTSAKIQLYGTKADGTVYLGSNSADVLGTVPEDGGEFTVKVTVDFENLKLIGRTEDGSIITQDIAIPESTGAATGLEYKALATTYVLYWQGGKANADASMRIEGIKVAEGYLF